MAKSKPTSPYQPKKGGFRVGPKLPKGVYAGHTKKIKDTLIHKATVKKQYYKDLAAEGYGDGVGVTIGGGTGSNGGKLGKRGREEEEVVEDEEEKSEGEESEEEAKGERRRQRKPTLGGESDDSDDDEEEEEEEARPTTDSKGKGKPAPPAPASKPRHRAGQNTRKPVARPAAPVTPAPTATPGVPAKRPRLSEEAIAALREKKKLERRDWAQKGSRGQPKLGARVEQLLGRIKRGMGQN